MAAAKLIGIKRTTMIDLLERSGINKLPKTEKRSLFRKIALAGLKGGMVYE
ncbi:MAG: hypothetical protein H6624_15520 [Bdellovibrionaceae bacterium]|nr:hypothetical protein [Pseudobdellovibrionaceae bacterium]